MPFKMCFSTTSTRRKQRYNRTRRETERNTCRRQTHVKYTKLHVINDGFMVDRARKMKKHLFSNRSKARAPTQTVEFQVSCHCIQRQRNRVKRTLKRFERPEISFVDFRIVNTGPYAMQV